MHPEQQTKELLLNSDFTVDNTSFTLSSVDCKGYSYATFRFAFGNVPANVAALKLQESDDDGSVDTYADVTGFTVGTSANTDGTTSALPQATGGDGTIVVFEVDLRTRERYLKPVVTAGNGSGTATEMSCICTLSRAADMPVTATERGCAEILRV